MTFQGINSSDVITQAKKLLIDNKKISSELRIVLGLMIQLIEVMSMRLATDSRNSSKPPSSDQKSKPHSKRKKRKKKSTKSPGGQKGHEGSTLEQYEDPDEIIDISIDQRTLPKGGNFKPSGFECRQVIEIEMKTIIREYRAEIVEDSAGNKYVATFPANITKAIQYGGTVKSFAVYMSQYQLIPYARVQEIFENQFDLNISQGTLYNFTKESYDLSEFFEEEAAITLANADVAHSDETGIRVNGETNWLHVLCTPKTTYFFPHHKRGREAIDAMGLLKDFNGVLCHDHWKPYFGYAKEHSLCSAHHLRELQWVVDFKSQKWASSMIYFLTKTNDLVKANGGALTDSKQKKKTDRYRDIISAGQRECPMTVPAKGSNKKKVAQTKERNLLDRLSKFEDEVLLFMRKKNVPFTNNQAEQDIRMVKVHQKITGGFRSLAGAKYFCRVRGLLITQKKRGKSPYTVLEELFTP